jgi:hypothetical protein
MASSAQSPTEQIVVPKQDALSNQQPRIIVEEVEIAPADHAKLPEEPAISA